MPRPLNVAALRGEAAFPQTPDHDLRFMGGRTIPHLTYTNLYVGGRDAWVPDETTRIDQALLGAMVDPGLCNVLRQYFKNAPISTQFAPSRVLDGVPPSTFGQKDVEDLVLKLHRDSQLVRFHLNLGSTVVNLVLPRGTVLTLDEDASDIRRVLPRATEHEEASSLYGLGGYHGSVHPRPGVTVYYAVSVYSDRVDGRDNGIVAFEAPWKNVVATLYHELCEARTDPDVGDAIRLGDNPAAQRLLGWVSDQGEEIGDFPVFEAGADLSSVMREVALASGDTAPVQIMYSNAHHGPAGPQARLCDLYAPRTVVPVLAPAPAPEQVIPPVDVFWAEAARQVEDLPPLGGSGPSLGATQPVASGESAGTTDGMKRTEPTEKSTLESAEPDAPRSMPETWEQTTPGESPQSVQGSGVTTQPMLIEPEVAADGSTGVLAPSGGAA